jgi:hypothetical protein
LSVRQRRARLIQILLPRQITNQSCVSWERSSELTSGEFQGTMARLLTQLFGFRLRLLQRRARLIQILLLAR